MDSTGRIHHVEPSVTKEEFEALDLVEIPAPILQRVEALSWLKRRLWRVSVKNGANPELALKGLEGD